MSDSTPSESIHKIERGDDAAQGRDLAAENRGKLAKLFPGLITEAIAEDGSTIPAVDADALRDLVGATVETESREKFGLSWHGKAAARRLALTPSTGTLRPCPGDDVSVDWDTTKNVMIEGDNLEVLKLLQKSYAGEIKLIYIDPPYNTGSDFVYKDDFRDPIGHYQRVVGERTEDGEALTSNPQTSGRFHTHWLNMIYPRLLLARELLREDGVILIHCDEHEDFHLKMLLESVFGGENDLGTIIWDKLNPKGDARGVAYQHEYLLCFARSAQKIYELGGVVREKENAKAMIKKAKQLISAAGNKVTADVRSTFAAWLSKQEFSGGEKMYKHIDDDGEIYRGVSMAWPNKKEAPDSYRIPLIHPITNKPCPLPSRGWRNPPETMKNLLAQGLILFGDDETKQPERKYLLSENMSENLPSVIRDASSDDDLMTEWGLPFENPKPFKFSAKFIAALTDEYDIILDCFAGSGTAGHAVMQQNATDGKKRRFVLVQLPEPTDREDFSTIAEMTKKRLRLAGEKVTEDRVDKPEAENLDTGFRVFKLDTANVKAWEAPTADTLDPGEINNLLEESVDGVKLDRSDEDLLWGAMLNLGLPLDGTIESHEINGMTVYAAGACTLLACFAKSIDRDAGETLAGGLADLIKQAGVEGDVTVVLRDSAFDGDDAVKVNLVENLRQHAPDPDKVRVLSI